LSAVGQQAGTGASRIRRLLSRALLVVGGTVAGTAAAWVLSTATASAEAPDADSITVVQQQSFDHVLPTVVHPVVDPAKRAVQDTDKALRAQRANTVAPPKLEQVASQFRTAVTQVTERFESRLPEAGDAAGRSVSGNTATVVPAVDDTTTAAPAPTGASPVQEPVHAVAEFGEKWAHETSGQRSALPDDSRPALPGGSSPLPLAPFAPPAGVPVHCGCGGDGSGSTGGHNMAAQAAFVNAYNSAVARALKPATERVSVMPGKQPGITPD
jgi:hypothetical protein